MKDVAAEGVLLGELNASLLQKIEEITLHLIRMEKQIQRQESRIRQLQRQKATR